MPKLPSGKYIGISSDRVIKWARGADFNNAMEFTMHIRTIGKMSHFIDLVYYPESGDSPSNGSEPEGAYLPGLRLSDISTERCDWCDQDKAWFSQWMDSPLFLEWFEALQAELHSILSNRPLPDILDGLEEEDVK